MSPRPNLHRPAVLILAVFLAAGSSTVGGQTRHANPARYLYVWAGSGNDTTKGVDVVTVLDANPASPAYGSVLAALTVDSAGKMPHHVELILPAKGPYYANDYRGDKSFLVDFSNPTMPRLAGRVAKVPGGRKLHSFARLANGHVLATVHLGDTTDGGKPRMLAEFDRNGRLIRSSSSRDPAFPGARIRTYALAIAYGHRYATLDVSDPSHPKEVASLATDPTFFPHWASADPGSDRIVFTDQGDGPPKVMIGHFDHATGRLSWDEKFRDSGSSTPGVSYHRDRWPNGITGMLMPHGALFVP